MRIKKQKLVYCFIIVLSLLTSVVLFGHGSYTWELSLKNIKEKIPANKKQIEFSPKGKNYKNKILSYITAIDNKLLDKIVILRVNSNPMTDYLFIDKKLYTVLENWGNITGKQKKKIQAELAKKYGKPQIQKNRNFYIYAYNDNSSKVLLYMLDLPGGKTKCKVYFYAKKLFRMLLLK